jgi:hypothetical protein
MKLPSFIYLYNGGRTENLKLHEISSYLKNIFKEKVIIQERADFITYYLSNLTPELRRKEINKLAKLLAAIKVRTIEDSDMSSLPLRPEIEYEKRIISDPENKSFGILYDGFKIMSLFANLIPEFESTLLHCHIVFTNRLLATWDEWDLRYHLRVGVYGFPSIISTSGVVEAPAKPREFYLKRQIGIDVNILKNEFRHRFIDYDDPRLSDVMKGYVMQAVFYHLTGNPFCEDKTCRLYNAHWQEEIINSQIKNTKSEFCNKHSRIIREG